MRRFPNRRLAIYAIVASGGKQYRVQEGRSVTVERLPAAEGETVELTNVLFIKDGEDVKIGTPNVAGARVLAEVESHSRGAKVLAFRYKSKTRARTLRGYKRHLTTLRIQQILGPGMQPKPKAAKEEAAPEAAPEKPSRRRARKSEATE